MNEFKEKILYLLAITGYNKTSFSSKKIRVSINPNLEWKTRKPANIGRWLDERIKEAEKPQKNKHYLKYLEDRDKTFRLLFTGSDDPATKNIRKSFPKYKTLWNPDDLRLLVENRKKLEVAAKACQRPIEECKSTLETMKGLLMVNKPKIPRGFAASFDLDNLGNIKGLTHTVLKKGTKNTNAQYNLYYDDVFLGVKIGGVIRLEVTGVSHRHFDKVYEVINAIKQGNIIKDGDSYDYNYLKLVDVFVGC